MHHIFNTDQATEIPRFLEPEVARERLAQKISRFITSAASGAQGSDVEPAPALALRVTAGTGKTAATLRAVGDHAEELLERGHVLFYMPTLALAERAAKEFGAIAPGVPTAVIRGRSALRPDEPTKTMCSRLELVERLGGLVPSITEAFCRARNEEGEIVEAPCAADCAYLEQRDAAGARVLFLSHHYLRLRPPIDPHTPVALRVIDEKCWSVLARTTSMTLEDFMRLPGAMDGATQTDHARTVATIARAMQSGTPVGPALRHAGISAERLTQLIKAETSSRPQLRIRPWDDELTARRRADLFNDADFTASLNRQSILKLIAEDGTDTCHRLTFREVLTTAGPRQIIMMHKLVPLPRDAHLLLLDADADPAITDRLAPGCEFASIDARPTAEIYQVSDLALSNSWLTDEKHGAGRRSQILDLVAREVHRAQGGGVLLVATKTVLKQMHLDVGNPCKSGDDEALLQPILGASPRWFGASTQGINDYQDYATVVIVGRMQPGHGDVEDIARCLFGDDPQPIAEHRGGPIPHRPGHVFMQSGQLGDVRFSMHPDPRAHAVLRQLRECGSAQAAARIRPIAPRHPKRMVFLCNIPLPGLPVTRLVPFAGVCRDLMEDPDPSGFLRLEAALVAVQDRSVIGTRLSATGLAEDLPRNFTSPNSGKEFRRGRSTSQMFALARRIAARHNWPITCLDLCRSGGGTPTPAIILCKREHAVRRAGEFWPGYIVKILP